MTKLSSSPGHDSANPSSRTSDNYRNPPIRPSSFSFSSPERAPAPSPAAHSPTPPLLHLPGPDPLIAHPVPPSLSPSLAYPPRHPPAPPRAPHSASSLRVQSKARRRPHRSSYLSPSPLHLRSPIRPLTPLQRGQACQFNQDLVREALGSLWESEVRTECLSAMGCGRVADMTGWRQRLQESQDPTGSKDHRRSCIGCCGGRKLAACRIGCLAIRSRLGNVSHYATITRQPCYSPFVLIIAQ